MVVLEQKLGNLDCPCIRAVGHGRRVCRGLGNEVGRQFQCSVRPRRGCGFHHSHSTSDAAADATGARASKAGSKPEKRIQSREDSANVDELKRWSKVGEEDREGQVWARAEARAAAAPPQARGPTERMRSSIRSHRARPAHSPDAQTPRRPDARSPNPTAAAFPGPQSFVSASALKKTVHPAARARSALRLHNQTSAVTAAEQGVRPLNTCSLFRRAWARVLASRLCLVFPASARTKGRLGAGSDHRRRVKVGFRCGTA